MKPKRLYFIMLGILILILVGTGVGIYFANSLLMVRTDALNQTLIDAAVASDHADDLTALKSQYLALQPKFAKLELSLPRAKKQSEIVLQVQKLADNNNVFIDSTSFSDSAGGGLPSAISQTAPAGDAIALPITFTAKATYGNFLNFLKNIEVLNRYTNVKSITVTSSTGADNKPSTAYTVTMNAYIKP